MLGSFRYCVLIMSVCWTRMKYLREDDRGMTTETMVLAGMLTVAAIGAITVIGFAIANRAQDIADDVDG